MCHEIDWLAPLEKFRKLNFFGYMFCCRKNQVKDILDGFPIFQIKTRKPHPPVFRATELPEYVDTYFGEE